MRFLYYLWFSIHIKCKLSAFGYVNSKLIVRESNVKSICDVTILLGMDEVSSC